MNFEKEEPMEQVILVAVDRGEGVSAEESLDELSELIETAGATCVGRLIQNREMMHNATYIGKGKIDELKALIFQTGATGIVCDDELSPAQMRNLGDILDVKIMDRTLVILDIFAQRATSKEGKIQVELAQLRYQASKLTGLGKSMSRLGGGIGTRGPGEKKLEMDRRFIHQRISILKRELEEVIKHREVQRSRRKDNHIPVVCLVGYTNVGKSSLLNRLTNASVLEENQLFATLDPTTRQYQLEGGQHVLLTDTVGFIRKLPHHLVEAFKSTLEEAKYADVIIHVVDCSNPQAQVQMDTVYETLRQLEVGDKPIITAFNKIDKEGANLELKDVKSDKQIYISVRENNNVEQLLELVEALINDQFIYVDRIYNYQEAGKIAVIRERGQLLKEEYLPEGIHVEAYVPRDGIAF